MVKIFLILVSCNIFNNDYQRGLRVLHTFLPNKQFDQFVLDHAIKSSMDVLKTDLKKAIKNSGRNW